jgi:hypothetical protein
MIEQFLHNSTKIQTIDKKNLIYLAKSKLHNYAYRAYIENWIIIMIQIPQITKVHYDALLAQYQNLKKLYPNHLKW